MLAIGRKGTFKQSIKIPSLLISILRFPEIKVTRKKKKKKGEVKEEEKAKEKEGGG